MKYIIVLFCFLTVLIVMVSVNASPASLQSMIDNTPNGGTINLVSSMGIGETLTVDKNLTINGPADGNVNIFNNNKNGVFVGLELSPGCNVKLNNVNFIGFKDYAIHSGEKSVLSFNKCGFSSSRGGVSSSGSVVSFSDCMFTDNFNNSVLKVAHGSSLVLNNSNFKDNTYVGGSGSCINGMNTNVSINNCTFEANHADIRGGSVSLDGTMDYNVLVNNSRVTGNTANGGGFLFTTGDGTYNVKLLNTNFNNNRAVGHDDGISSVNGVGGVILSTGSSYSYLLSDNTIHDNSATGGGALLACFREGGSFTFNGNTFKDNLWMVNDILQVEAKNNLFYGV